MNFSRYPLASSTWGTEEIESMQKVIASGKFTMGEKVKEFEAEFAKSVGSKYAVMVNSGSSANLVLLTAGKYLSKPLFTQDDEVIVPAVSWSTTYYPVNQIGCKLSFVDIELDTLNIDPAKVTAAITPKTKAILAVNLLGNASNLNELKKIANEHGLHLLEDNCESLGTKLPEGKAGNFGLGASFSFFVAHHMSTIEGGMVCTDDEEFAEMLRIVRANGWDRNLNAKQQVKWRKKYKILSEFEAKYTFYDLGFNFRPTEITGFLGQYQLQFLDSNINLREANYLRLENIMNDNDDLISLKHDHISKLSTFAIPIVCRSSELRGHYLSRFSGAGIEIRPMIAGNMQRQPFYSKYVKETFNLPGTDFLHENGFYCGNYPELTENDLETISSCLYKY